MEPILNIEHLAVGYGSSAEEAILPPIDARLYPGELVGLLGSNGAGKSTLLRTVAASQRPLAGCVKVAGRDISRCSPRELARLIAIVYTDRVQAGGLTVRQVVALGRYPHISALGMMKTADNDAVDEALAVVGISGYADRYLSRLSDGERQKVMIARTLAQQTPVIILDEPTTFLDVASRLEMFALLRRLAQEQQKAIIVSTHEVAQVLDVATRLWLITADRQMLDGSPDRLVADGSIDRLFSAESGVRFAAEQHDFVLNARPSDGATGSVEA